MACLLMGVDVSDNFHQIYLFKYRRSHVKLKHGPSFPTLILPIWPMSSSPVQESLDSWLPNGGPLKLLSRYKKTSWIILLWLGVAMQHDPVIFFHDQAAGVTFFDNPWYYVWYNHSTRCRERQEGRTAHDGWLRRWHCIQQKRICILLKPFYEVSLHTCIQLHTCIEAFPRMQYSKCNYANRPWTCNM